jgi:hypothetical protein
MMKQESFPPLHDLIEGGGGFLVGVRDLPT